VNLPETLAEQIMGALTKGSYIVQVEFLHEYPEWQHRLEISLILQVQHGK